MLQVKGNIGELIKAAQSTGSLESLTAKLQYLNGWGESAPYAVQVEVFVDDNGKEADVKFLSKTGVPMMVGGLVYHEHSNEWGVHT